MTIEITALDTLFFRDGKPFSMGEDVWASGIFPPAPSVFYGMLRTTCAAQNNIPANDIEEKTKDLKITGVFLKQEEKVLFPYPADFITFNDKTQQLIPKPNKVISNIHDTNLPYVLMPYLQTNQKANNYFGKAFIDYLTLPEYLANEYGQGEEIHIIKQNDIIYTEPKVGIAKENETNKTDEGKIYRVGMFRPENKDYKKLKFILEFEGLEIKNEGFVRLGAESKVGYYTKTDQQKINFPEPENGLLKIYLTTPAIFNKGFIPEFIEKEQIDGINLKLLTYSIDKPVYIGGFDMKNRKPKPMKKAVPAGSVYYLETDKPKELAEIIHGKSVSEKYAEQGFGICYCGTFSL